MVRELKAKKAEKPVVDQAVSELLELKRQLALAKGEDPSATKKSGKKSKKK